MTTWLIIGIIYYVFSGLISIGIAIDSTPSYVFFVCSLAFIFGFILLPINLGGILGKYLNE